MPDWLAALIAVGAGLVIGSIAGRVARALLGHDRRPEPLREMAGPIAMLIFSIILIAGMITALGFVNETALDELPQQVVDYVPRVLSAAIVLIIANIVSTLVVGVLDKSLGMLSPSARRQIPMAARGFIMFAGVLIAGSQLRVDVTILTIATACLFGGVALAAALMIGVGSRDVAAEIAAGRAVRRIIDVGDRVVVDGLSGEITAMHAVAIELERDDGEHVTLPFQQLLGNSFTVERATGASTTDGAVE